MVFGDVPVLALQKSAPKPPPLLAHGTKFLVGFTVIHYVGFCSGALTHSVKALDISLKIDTELALEVGRRTKRA